MPQYLENIYRQIFADSAINSIHLLCHQKYNNEYMKVKQEILDRINNVASRRVIAEKLDIGDQMLYKHIKANSEDGPLTKMIALLAISEETSVPVTGILDYGITEKEVKVN